MARRKPDENQVRSLEAERGPLEEKVEGLRSTVKDMYREFVAEFRLKTTLTQESADQGAKASALRAGGGRSGDFRSLACFAFSSRTQRELRLCCTST